jgi:hypothetical protein
MSLIHGITAGKEGTFMETPLPGGIGLQEGGIPTWSADDPLVTITDRKSVV